MLRMSSVIRPPGGEARVEEVAEAGDRVLVLWRQSMVGAGGGVPLVVHTAQVCSVHEGRVTRIDNYTDQAEALEAVGLSRCRRRAS